MIRTGSAVPNKPTPRYAWVSSADGLTKAASSPPFATSSARMAEPDASRSHGRNASPEPLPTVMTMSRLPPYGVAGLPAMCRPISHKVLARTKLAPFGNGSIAGISYWNEWHRVSTAMLGSEGREFTRRDRTEDVIRSAPGIVRRNRDSARPVRAIAPGVVGTALDNGIAGFEVDFFGVEHQGDLAFQNKTEIERLRFLHVRMRRGGRRGGCGRRARGMKKCRDLRRPDLAAKRPIRRQRDDPAHRASRRRFKRARISQRRVAKRADLRRRRAGDPDARRREARPRRIGLHVGRRAVRNRDRLAVFIVDRDDAPHRLDGI